MIVRSRDDGEIESVGKAEDVVTLLLNRSHTLGGAVTQLHRVQPREAVLLVLGQLRQVAGNREDQKRRRAGDGDTRVRLGIVPVALGIVRERRVDSDRYDVLVVITRLESREQNGAIAGVRGISRGCRHRARKTLVIGDVRRVESRARVPLPITLRREPLARIPRRIGVTVKVDDHVLWITYPDPGHGTRNDGTGTVHDHDACQCRQCNARLARYRGTSRPCTNNPPDDHAQRDRQQDRRVLAERQQRQRIEDVADRREHRVRRRVNQRCVCHRKARLGVSDGGRTGKGGRQNDRRGGQHRS